MDDTTCERLWLRSLLIELGFPPPLLIRMYSDNEAANFIASNETFHMCMKHIEIDCHFIHHCIMNMMICMMDIIWPISQSHFHVSCLCSLK